MSHANQYDGLPWSSGDSTYAAVKVADEGEKMTGLVRGLLVLIQALELSFVALIVENLELASFLLDLGGRGVILVALFLR